MCAEEFELFDKADFGDVVFGVGCGSWSGIWHRGCKVDTQRIDSTEED